MELSNEAIARICDDFDLKLLRWLDPYNFKRFRSTKAYPMEHSEVWKNHFLRCTGDISKAGRTMIVATAAVIKEKGRIMDFLMRFHLATWFPEVWTFYDTRVRYDFEEIVEGKITVSIIPTCFPFISAMAWKFSSEIYDRTIENFIRNEWAAQINLGKELMMGQKVWEICNLPPWPSKIEPDIWDISTYPDMEHWEGKSKEKFPFIGFLGFKWSASSLSDNGEYTMRDVEQWLQFPNPETLKAFP